MPTKWRVEVSESGNRDIARLDHTIRLRVLEKLSWLEDNFDFVIPLVLQGEYKGFYKLRVGDWRIIYTIDWSAKYITVEYVDLRDKIYKRKR